MSKSLVLVLAIILVWFFIIRGDKTSQSFTNYSGKAGTFTTGQGFSKQGGTLGGGTYGGGGGR